MTQTVPQGETVSIHIRLKKRIILSINLSDQSLEVLITSDKKLNQLLAGSGNVTTRRGPQRDPGVKHLGKPNSQIALKQTCS